MPGYFEFPHRWTEIAPLFLADDDENPAAKTAKINQGISYLDDRDRAAEDRFNALLRFFDVAVTTTGQTLTAAAFTKVTFDTNTVSPSEDLGFDLATDSIAIPVTGVYWVGANAHSSAVANVMVGSLFVGGAERLRGIDAAGLTCPVSGLMRLNAGDVLDFRVYNRNATNIVTVGGVIQNFFHGYRIL